MTTIVPGLASAYRFSTSTTSDEASNASSVSASVKTSTQSNDSVELDLSPAARIFIDQASASSVSANAAVNADSEETAGSYPPDLTNKIADSKRRVRQLVGNSGASDVVDSYGNIDTTKLAKLIAQQR